MNGKKRYFKKKNKSSKYKEETTLEIHFLKINKFYIVVNNLYTKVNKLFTKKKSIYVNDFKNRYVIK